MAGSRGPRAPGRLGVAGGALWRSIVAVFELDVRELSVLEAACAQADDVALLEGLLATEGLFVTGSKGQPRLTPVVCEIRQGRLALARLLGDLALPADVGARPMTASSAHATRAANARWNRMRLLREEG